MEKYKLCDIYKFRELTSVLDKEEININLISNLLKNKGVVEKEFGLCDEPFNFFYDVCHTNKRGVSFVGNPLNEINIILNEATSTRKKRIYFYSIQINYINKAYYVCCLAQSTLRKKNIVGANTIVYMIQETELSEIIDKIFNDVELCE